MLSGFDLQGHRGARGLRPENTLPSFEAALDAGVTSIETDLHLTRDDEIVLIHDPLVTHRLYRPIAPDPRPPVRSLTLGELRRYTADCNPDPARFSEQRAEVTPLARVFAEKWKLHPFAVPTLADLFEFAAAYAGPMGEECGKTSEQRAYAAQVRFDLELKRVPLHPEYIGDAYNGNECALLEHNLVKAVRAAGVSSRTTVRSFDHRCVALLLKEEPELKGAVLVDGTAPHHPGELARQAGATLYCPNYEFVDAHLVRSAHDAGIRVFPWTVNEEKLWRQLLDMGVDGITTDYPDRLAECLRKWGVTW